MKLVVLLVVVLAIGAFAHDRSSSSSDAQPKECPVQAFYSRHVQCRSCVSGGTWTDRHGTIHQRPAMKWCVAENAKSDRDGTCVSVTTPCTGIHKDILTVDQCINDAPSTKQSCTLCAMDGYTWCQDADHPYDEYAGSCVASSPEDEFASDDDIIGGGSHDYDGRRDGDDDDEDEDDSDDEDDDEESSDDRRERHHGGHGSERHHGSGSSRHGHGSGDGRRHGWDGQRRRFNQYDYSSPSVAPSSIASSTPSAPVPSSSSSSSPSPSVVPTPQPSFPLPSDPESSSPDVPPSVPSSSPLPPSDDLASSSTPPPSSSFPSSGSSSSSSSSSSFDEDGSSSPPPPPPDDTPSRPEPRPRPVAATCPINARRVTRFTECGPMKMMSRIGRGGYGHGHGWKKHAHRSFGLLVPCIVICLAACCLRRRCKRRCHERRQRRQQARDAAVAAGRTIPTADQYPGNVRVNIPVAHAIAIATPVAPSSSTTPVVAAPVIPTAPLVYSHAGVAAYVVPAAAAAAPVAKPSVAVAAPVEMRSPVAVEGTSMYPSLGGGRNGYARVGDDDAI